MNQKLIKHQYTLLFIFFILAFPVKAQEWIESPLLPDNEPFSLDMDGNYAIVGSPFNETDAGGQNDIDRAGAAFIYRLGSSGNWEFMQKIVAADRGNQDKFGFDVAISSEGYVLVGTEFENAAYFFELNGNTWSEVQKIEGEQLQRFGVSVAMHEDKALIGAPGDDDFVGAAYSYQRDGNSGQWVEDREMKPPSSEQQGFGQALDISQTYIIIGAPFLDGSASEPNLGAAYIFTANGTFGQALNFPLLQPGDRFGAQVAISEGTAIVGIPEHPLDDGGADDQGALNDGVLHPGIVGIFSGASWNLQKIVSPDRSANDQFGVWVDIQGDVAIVGADQEGLNANGEDFQAFAGLAYILERGGNGWSVVDKIEASDRDSFDNFGSRVAIGSLGASVIADDKTYFYRRCTEAQVSSIMASSTSICQGESVLLTAMGLADGQGQWYLSSCGGSLLGAGNTLEVTPDATTTYFVSAGNCGAQVSCVDVTITVNPLPEISASTTQEMSGNDGTIDLTVTGGSPPYTYDWDTDGNNDFDDPEDLEELSSGTYTVTVRDNVGCTASLSIDLGQEMVTGLTVDNKTFLKVYPNPHTEGALYIELVRELPTNLTIKDLHGRALQRYALRGSEQLNLNTLPKGAYLLEFLFENKRLVKRWVKL
ncbi:MAG: T9SS type A sorting domain-containing protein [Bacteroidota bacterium]